MKHLSLEKLAETVISKRKAMGMSQTVLAERTGINRTMFTRLENKDYTPSVDQLLALSEVLGFDCASLFEDDAAETSTVDRMKIAVAGTGYVGLSLAVLLSQHNDVTAVDIVPEKVELINNKRSPIQDFPLQQLLTASLHTRTQILLSLQLLLIMTRRQISSIVQPLSQFLPLSKR